MGGAGGDFTRLTAAGRPGGMAPTSGGQRVLRGHVNHPTTAGSLRRTTSGPKGEVWALAHTAWEDGGVGFTRLRAAPRARGEPGPEPAYLSWAWRALGRLLRRQQWHHWGPGHGLSGSGPPDLIRQLRRGPLRQPQQHHNDLRAWDGGRSGGCADRARQRTLLDAAKGTLGTGSWMGTGARHGCSPTPWPERGGRRSGTIPNPTPRIDMRMHMAHGWAPFGKGPGTGAPLLAPGCTMAADYPSRWLSVRAPSSHPPDPGLARPAPTAQPTRAWTETHLQVQPPLLAGVRPNGDRTQEALDGLVRTLQLLGCSPQE